MGINIFLYVEEGIEQLCKNFFFFNLFSISFFNIFMLLGRRVGIVLLYYQWKCQYRFLKFFGGGGAGLHRNKSHHELLTVRSQTTGTLWLSLLHFDRKVGNPFPALWFDCLVVLCGVFSYSNLRNPYPYIYIQPEKIGKGGSWE